MKEREDRFPAPGTAGGDCIRHRIGNGWIGENAARTGFGVCIVALIGVCLAATGVPCARAAEAGYQIPWIRLSPEKPGGAEWGVCNLDFYSYVQTNKKGENPLAALGALVSVGVGHGWELRASGDVLSWQDPHAGLGDASLGAKWNFLQGAFSSAAALDVEFPSGAKEFREPGPEPTLSLIAARKIGAFEPNCTLSCTYVSAERFKDWYMSYQLSVGSTYALTDVHSFGFYATGYTPRAKDRYSPCISIEGSYTYNIDADHSWSVTIDKGLMWVREMDWSVGVSYDVSFDLRSLFKRGRP